MRSIDADDELFAAIAGKPHFKLASFVRLRPCVQFFLSNLIVEPFANPDGSLAHGGIRLGRLNGQEFGKHSRRLPVRHHTPQPRRQFHRL
ncbi:Putative TNP2-like transposon protein (plasmid) [Mesorhizobium loti]|nr:Putative TNP2-like transposon protein [Mesorhizobium loti]